MLRNQSRSLALSSTRYTETPNIRPTRTAGQRIAPVTKAKSNRIDIGKVHTERLKVDRPLAAAEVAAYEKFYDSSGQEYTKLLDQIKKTDANGYFILNADISSQPDNIREHLNP